MVTNNSYFHTFSFTAQSVAKITKGTVLFEGTDSCCGISTDSRRTEPGNIFIAIRGENTDGHRYIDSAASSGAGCIVCEEIHDEILRILPKTCSVVLVKNSLAALGAFGSWMLDRVAPKVIAITGSVGKTTTKQMIYSVVSAKGPTLKTEENYNNEIGLPQTLLCLESDQKIAVLEAGMNHAGELSRLSHICKPDIAVITNIGTAHIENLGSRDNIRNAKMEILDGMRSGGTVIYNGDEPLLNEKRSEMEARGLKPFSYSVQDADSDYYAFDLSQSATGSTFSVKSNRTGKTVHNVRISEPGEHLVMNALAAFACGESLELPISDILSGISGFVNIRQNLVTIASWTVIDDCYNASPESVKAELKVLSKIAKDKGKRAIAVLGDMLELGDRAPSLHREVGVVASENCDLLISFGPLAEEYVRGALANGFPKASAFSVCQTENVESLIRLLSSVLLPDDVLLFKASHSVHMERVVEALRIKYCK